jgi:hypothetical protein
VRWVAGHRQRLQLPKSLPTNAPNVVTSWWFATAMRSARQVVPTVHACCTQPGPLPLQLRPCCTSVGIAGVLEGSGPLRAGAISSELGFNVERLPGKPRPPRVGPEVPLRVDEHLGCMCVSSKC